MRVVGNLRKAVSENGTPVHFMLKLSVISKPHLDESNFPRFLHPTLSEHPVDIRGSSHSIPPHRHPQCSPPRSASPRNLPPSSPPPTTPPHPTYHPSPTTHHPTKKHPYRLPHPLQTRIPRSSQRLGLWKAGVSRSRSAGADRDFGRGCGSRWG